MLTSVAGPWLRWIRYSLWCYHEEGAGRSPTGTWKPLTIGWRRWPIGPASALTNAEIAVTKKGGIDDDS